jgi:Ca2+-binding EF-hand superfamily protein
LLRFVIAAISMILAGAVQVQAQPIPRTQFIADMDTQFRKMDADKNGLLSRVEIEQFQKLTAIAEAQARNRALFAQLDADRNGQLSPAEFSKVTAPSPPANATPMLSREDGNRDGQISLVEHRTATLANFDRLDADKDGIVTPAEMKAGGIAAR